MLEINFHLTKWKYFFNFYFTGHVTQIYQRQGNLISEDTIKAYVRKQIQTAWQIDVKNMKKNPLELLKKIGK